MKTSATKQANQKRTARNIAPMFFQIISVEAAGNMVREEKDMEPTVEVLVTRVYTSEIDRGKAKVMLHRAGFEPCLDALADPKIWPYVAIVYVSDNVDGNGRTSERFGRIQVRRKSIDD